MQKLMKALGYTFRDESLLRQALTHPSMGLPDNQRLEFLGDAVLQWAMSDMLYREHPDAQEGQLTHLRALLVCEATLSEIGRRLGVGEALIMDHGESITGGRCKPSVLCDAVEAILAAVYLDGGLAAAQELVRRHWPRPEEVHRPAQDSKSRLQELLQQSGGETPVYRIVAQSGTPNAPSFVASVTWQGKEIGRGSGPSKKSAEKAAALSALQTMEREED